MRKKLYRQYNLEVNFGSDFQQVTWGDMLDRLIATWALYVITRHKKTKVYFNGKQIGKLKV